MLCNNVLEAIGNTPLIKLNHINGTDSTIYVKFDGTNPGGSSKDRAAIEMINSALEEGKINKESVIIEPTSGNTGIGLAMVCAAYGMKLLIVMPDNMSEERRKLIKGYGAELVLTPANEGMKGALDKAEALKKENPNSFIPQQFANPDNPKAHYLTTGPEIYQDLNGKLDYFVAGIGTGGTISGVGKYLKQENADIKIIGVEPLSSPLLTKKQAGPHKIQGIGANFVPENLDLSLMNEVLDCPDEQAFIWAKRLMKEEGIAAGISSGAAIWGAMQIANRPEAKGKVIVAFLPDNALRYLSTNLYD